MYKKLSSVKSRLLLKKYVMDSFPYEGIVQNRREQSLDGKPVLKHFHSCSGQIFCTYHEKTKSPILNLVLGS